MIHPTTTIDNLKYHRIFDQLMTKNTTVGIVISCLFLLSILLSSADAEEKCIYRRYIFDIGSSATKSAAYTVDSCKKVILSRSGKHLHQNYRYCLIHDGENYLLPEDCMERGVTVLQELQKHYGIDCRKNHCVGFATAWARDANNTDEWLQKVRGLGIKMQFLSQEKEGILSFKAIESKASQYGIDRHQMLVLDIGGGSTQLSGVTGENYFAYKGPYGTDTFIIHLLAKFRPDQVDVTIGEHIKNPILFHSSEIDDVINYSNELWHNSISQNRDIAQKIENGNVNLVGIGVLMKVGVRKQLGLDKEVITRDEVRSLIKSMCDLSKEQLNEKYPLLNAVAFSSQSAMLILYGIMTSLGVDSMRISEDDVMSYIALNPRSVE